MRSEVETETLRCPRRCSDESEIRSHQPYHRSNSPTWSQDFPSLHSSLEDVSEILDSGLNPSFLYSYLLFHETRDVERVQRPINR